MGVIWIIRSACQPVQQGEELIIFIPDHPHFIDRYQFFQFGFPTIFKPFLCTTMVLIFVAHSCSYLHLDFKEIASVDDLKLTITSRMFMYMKWIDERIISNMSDKEDLAILVRQSVFLSIFVFILNMPDRNYLAILVRQSVFLSIFVSIFNIPAKKN